VGKIYQQQKLAEYEQGVILDSFNQICFGMAAKFLTLIGRGLIPRILLLRKIVVVDVPQRWVGDVRHVHEVHCRRRFFLFESKYFAVLNVVLKSLVVVAVSRSQSGLSRRESDWELEAKKKATCSFHFYSPRSHYRRCLYTFVRRGAHSAGTERELRLNISE
jgi:hypothetical protein